MKDSFLERSDAAKDAWLSNFSTKIGGAYATKYGISTVEITDMIDSYKWWHFWYDFKVKTNEYNQKMTAFKNQIRDGVPAGASPAIAPVAPTLGTVPTAVLPGVFARAASIGKRIKNNVAYTEADGRDLGLEGADVIVDVDAMQPLLSVRLVGGGHPEIVWSKNRMQAIEIYVSRNAGDPFTFLAIDTTPNYTDTFALPPAGATATWRYKAIYRFHDEQVGVWSEETSKVVAGTV